MCKAYSYVRFSHPSQASGDSKRRQTETLEAFCLRHGLTLDPVSYQDLGISAFRGRNKDEGALAAFRQAVADGKIKDNSVLIVEQLDRLTRIEPDEAIALFGSILRSGVRIGHLRKDRILDKSCLKGFAIMEFVAEMILANEESAKKSERVSASLAQNKKRAKDGRIWTAKGPAWLRLVGDKWEVLEDEAKKVRLIYKLCIDGLGVEAIAKKLVKDGIPPMPKSKVWTRGYVRNILRDKIALGEYQPTVGKDRTPVGSPIVNYYTPIITEATFYQAQAALDTRIRHRGPTSKFINVLGGLIFDAASNSTMYLASKPQRNGTTAKQLYPSASLRSEAKYWSVNLDIVETAILASVRELNFTVDQSEDRKTLDGLLAKKETLQGRIQQVTKTIADTPDFDSAMQVLSTLEASRNATELEIEQLEAKLATTTEDSLEQAKQAILSMDRTLIRAKLRHIIDKISLQKTDEGLDIVVQYKGNAVRHIVLTDEKLTRNVKYSH